MNFTSEVRMSPDGQYGSIQSDGTWNGMVRELQLQNADIGDKQSYLPKLMIANPTSSNYVSAVAPFTVTKERSEAVTFAQPITEIYHSLFIKNPEGSMNLKSYIAPLTMDTWMAIGTFVVVGSLCLYLTSQ